MQILTLVHTWGCCCSIDDGAELPYYAPIPPEVSSTAGIAGLVRGRKGELHGYLSPRENHAFETMAEAVDFKVNWVDDACVHGLHDTAPDLSALGTPPLRSSAGINLDRWARQRAYITNNPLTTVVFYREQKADMRAALIQAIEDMKE